MDYTKMLMTGAAAALLTVSGFAADAKAKPAPKAAPKAAAPAAKAAPVAKKVDPFSVLPEVLAEMNGKKITRQELVNDVKKMSPDGKIPEQLTPEMIKAFAYEWTNRNVLGKLMNKAIADAKFTMSTKEIEQSIADQIKTLPAEYQKMMITQLEQQKLTLAQYITKMVEDPAAREQFLFQNFLQKKVIKNVDVTVAEARKYYDANKAQFTVSADAPGTIRASHILIAVKKGTDGKAELKQANELYAQLMKNPSDFGKLAAEKSACPSGKQTQGSLGAFQKGNMVPEFEKATLALKDNQISKPVKTQFGWHIIKREPLRKSEVKPFEVVKDEIMMGLKGMKQQEQVAKYIDALKKKANVKINVSQPAPMMMPGM